jgi:hypothetical protein
MRQLLQGRAHLPWILPNGKDQKTRMPKRNRDLDRQDRKADRQREQLPCSDVYQGKQQARARSGQNHAKK